MQKDALGRVGPRTEQGARTNAIQPLLVCMIIAIVLQGCANQDLRQQDAGDQMETGITLREVVNPPTHIPDVWAYSENGKRVEGRLVYFSWIIEGEYQDYEATQLPVMEPVTIEDDSLEAELSTGIEPSSVFAVTHEDAGRIPSNEGVIEECSSDQDVDLSCSYHVDRTVKIELVPPVNADLVVINIGWYVPQDLRADDSLPAEVSASWVFVVERT